MDAEGSLPCSQEPETGQYPEPDESNPYPRTLFFFKTVLKLSAPKSSSDHSASEFPTKMLQAFLSSPCSRTLLV
jgi:hypothetical protein